MRRCFSPLFQFPCCFLLLLLLLGLRSSLSLPPSFLLSARSATALGPRHGAGTTQWDKLDGSSGVLDTTRELVAPREAGRFLFIEREKGKGGEEEQESGRCCSA